MRSLESCLGIANDALLSITVISSLTTTVINQQLQLLEQDELIGSLALHHSHTVPSFLNAPNVACCPFHENGLNVPTNNAHHSQSSHFPISYLNQVESPSPSISPHHFSSNYLPSPSASCTTQEVIGADETLTYGEHGSSSLATTVNNQQHQERDELFGVVHVPISSNQLTNTHHLQSSHFPISHPDQKEFSLRQHQYLQHTLSILNEQDRLINTMAPSCTTHGPHHQPSTTPLSNTRPPYVSPSSPVSPLTTHEPLAAPRQSLSPSKAVSSRSSRQVKRMMRAHIWRQKVPKSKFVGSPTITGVTGDEVQVDFGDVTRSFDYTVAKRKFPQLLIDYFMHHNTSPTHASPITPLSSVAHAPMSPFANHPAPNYPPHCPSENVVNHLSLAQLDSVSGVRGGAYTPTLNEYDELNPTPTTPPTNFPNLVSLSFKLLQNEEWSRSVITQDLNEFLLLGLQINEDLRRRVLLNHYFTGHLEVLPAIENDLRRSIMTEAKVSYDSLAHDSCRVLLQQPVRDHGSQCGQLLFNYSVACLSTGEDLMRCSTQREYSLSLTPLLNAQERLLRGAVGSLQRARYRQILLASVECQEELHRHSLLRSLVLAVLCLQEFQTRTLTTDELLAEHLHAVSAHHPSNIMSQETAHALHYHYHEGLYNIQRSSWVERFIISHRILFHLEGSQRSALFQEQFLAFLTILTLAESQRRQDVACIELICSTRLRFRQMRDILPLSVGVPCGLAPSGFHCTTAAPCSRHLRRVHLALLERYRRAYIFVEWHYGFSSCYALSAVTAHRAMLDASSSDLVTLMTQATYALHYRVSAPLLDLHSRTLTLAASWCSNVAIALAKCTALRNATAANSYAQGYRDILSVFYDFWAHTHGWMAGMSTVVVETQSAYTEVRHQCHLRLHELAVIPGPIAIVLASECLESIRPVYAGIFAVLDGSVLLLDVLEPDEELPFCAPMADIHLLFEHLDDMIILDCYGQLWGFAFPTEHVRDKRYTSLQAEWLYGTSSVICPTSLTASDLPMLGLMIDEVVYRPHPPSFVPPFGLFGIRELAGNTWVCWYGPHREQEVLPWSEALVMYSSPLMDYVLPRLCANHFDGPDTMVQFFALISSHKPRCALSLLRQPLYPQDPNGWWIAQPTI